MLAIFTIFFLPSHLSLPSPSIFQAVWLVRRTESSDLLSVLDQLDPDTLSDSGVGLLGLNTNLLENYALGVRGTSERRGLVGGSKEALLVVQIGPSSLTTMVAELAGGIETSRLS